MNWSILLPILLPIVVFVFVIISKEPIWKKLSVLTLFIALTIARFAIENITIIMVITYIQIILCILLLLYYRNRGVI